MKDMLFPKYTPNGLHGIGVPYSINVSLRPSTHSLSDQNKYLSDLRVKILHSPVLSKLLNPVKNSAF